MYWDLLVIVLYGIGVISGVWTLDRHHSYFLDFRVKDLFNGRTDGWVYIVNAVSTSLCLIAGVLRLMWALEGGWETHPSRWAILWLSLHAGHALQAITVHNLTNILLAREEICQLCKRPWPRNDGS